MFIEKWLPVAASSFAKDIDGLMVFITVVVGVWFILAEALLLTLAFVYRNREGRKAAYLPANTLRGAAIVLIPCVIVLGFDLWVDSVATPIWDHIKIERPQHDTVVRITGEQWSWRFRYPGPDGELDTADDFEVVNELHVPLNKVVLFELEAKDVVHSLWVPTLRLKQDAVPGRSIQGWFEPTLAGRYEIICAEICGFGHTMMKAAIVVDEAPAYQAWLDSKAPAPPAAAEAVPAAL